MVKKCFKCEKIVDNHYSGLCKECYNIFKDNPKKMEYYEYRELIELDKEFTVRSFSDALKIRYNKLKQKFGDLKIIYS